MSAHGGSASAGAMLERGASWLRRRLLEPEPPLLALEVRSRSLGVVRLVREGRRRALAAAASYDLPAGTLKLAIAQPNVADPDAFGRTLRAVLERAGVLDGGRIGLVLPDPLARVALYPASELKARRRAEVEELIRFRLRKAVPFDIREASVAWLDLGSLRGGEAMVLVAAIFRPVLEGYERLCEAAGLEPGLVELCGLALLRAAASRQAAGDHLLANWDEDYVSLILTRDGAPLLMRTLAGDVAASPEHVVREVANTALYHRERLGGAGLDGALVRCAAWPPEDTTRLLQEALGFAPEILDPWAPLGGADGGPMGQAVAGAAACVSVQAA